MLVLTAHVNSRGSGEHAQPSGAMGLSAVCDCGIS